MLEKRRLCSENFSKHFFCLCAVPLAFRTRPKPKAVRVGTNIVTYKCDATGEPRPNITWYRNIQPIPKEERIDMGQDLRYSIVYSKDIGVYQCVADNGLEMIQSSAEFYGGKFTSLIMMI